MVPSDRPESIENQWDILYAQYPEVYDRFARLPYRPSVAEFLAERFPLAGRTLADIGTGTGLSALALASFAGQVIGVEPEPAMLRLARQAALEARTGNAHFVAGCAERIPLAAGAVDVLTAITMSSLYDEAHIAAFDREATRVVGDGGTVLIVEVARGWYGGELAPILFRHTWGKTFDYIKEQVLPGYGYGRVDFDSVQDYGTVENAVQTYGFIFGRAAIEYLRAHGKSTIRWKWSVFYKSGCAS